MPVQVLMPALSPTMEKGNLAKWIKNEGDKVKAGDVIAEIETDKATMEVEAVDEGILAKILVPAGTEKVPVNDVIAVLIEDGEDVSSVVISNAAPAKREISKLQGDSSSASPPRNDSNRLAPAPQVQSGNRIKASPLAKRIAKDRGIDIASVKGSGPLADTRRIVAS